MSEDYQDILRAQATLRENQSHQKKDSLRKLEQARLEELAIPQFFQGLVKLLQSKDPETEALRKTITRCIGLRGDNVKTETTDDLFITLGRRRTLEQIRKVELLAKVDTDFNPSGHHVLLAKPWHEGDINYEDGTYLYRRQIFFDPEAFARGMLDFIETPASILTQGFFIYRSVGLGPCGIKDAGDGKELSVMIDNSGVVRQRVVDLLKV